MAGEAEVHERDYSTARFEEVDEAEFLKGEAKPEGDDKEPPKDDADDETPPKGGDGDDKGADNDEPEGKGDDETKDKDGDDAAAKRKRKPNRFQKRINDLTKRAGTAETRAERLERENAELKAKLTESAGADDPRPNFANYDDPAKYEEELLAWRDREREREAAKAAPNNEDGKPSDDTPELTAEQRTVLDGVYNTSLDAAERYPDFEDVVINNADVVIEYEVVKQAVESDTAADVLYYLGKHPEEAERISGLHDNPVAVAREIAKVEARLEAGLVDLTPKLPAEPDPDQDTDQPPAKPPNQGKKPTSAPPPITPPRGGEGGDPADDSKLSDDEWFRREKQRQGLVD